MTMPHRASSSVGGVRGAASGKAPARLPKAGKGRTVLFLDPNPTIRAVARAVLERDGYRVVEAGTLAEGVAAAVREPLDLLVAEIDWECDPPGRGRGDRRDGLEVLDALRLVRPGLPCVFLGAAQVDRAYVEAVEGEGIPFVAKPFAAPRLLRAAAAAVALGVEAGFGL
ncbi:MAG TPA: response regulator [Candidatus Methylacidiphilales bacterium]